MSVAILDGKGVDAALITVAHRYVGMWRPPVDPLVALGEENLRCEPEERYSVIHCRCGENLWYIDTGHVHWKKGCFDLPQYVTVKENDDG